ncbi:TPA: sodium-translocating pyrophosphatase, partial [Candidatus Acetothermia bacterium]|nr:sodium-translocating pyrophosphatase [Candidatus Acetothermia bacterium]
MAIFIAIPAVIVVLAIVGATSFNRYVVRQDAGSPRMKELQQYIRRGAYTFMVEESKVMGIAMLIVGAVLWILFSWDIAVAFWVGSLFAMSAGFIGMNAATHANVRTANAAKRSFKEALNIAFSGGSVMGLAVAGLALGGLLLVFLLFHSTLDPETIHIETRYLFGLEGAGVNFIRIALLISAYSMGASLVALFDRVGGGVYTKAADMAADLVGKVEEGIPEDDPRNPATIADNVGDNVGDVAGLGADLLESFVGAIISIIIISAYIFVGRDNPPLQPLLAQLGLADGIYGSTYWWFIFLPVLIVAGGIVACFCGILYIRFNRRPEEKQPTVLMNGTRIAAFFTVLTTFFITWFSPLSMMPFYAVLLGIVAGVAIGFFSEYYTSAKYKSVQMLAKVNQTGPAIGVTEGMAIGMLSTFLPIIVIAAAILISYHIGGLIGIAYGALGMLSFVAMTVAVDSYGPIADNAGGIATMAKMDPEIRNRTDRLDSIGNTTAAIGKGFAIGSAVFASLGLIAAYLWAAIDRAELVLPPQLPLIGQIAADLSPTGYPVEVAAFVL